MTFRLVHISDLHFAKIHFGISQFFSKRWVGNAHLVLRRKKEMSIDLLDPLLSSIASVQPDLILISGDLTSTSSLKEFKQALEFTSKLKTICPKIAIIPGNHDHYTKKAYRLKRFYDFFPSHPLKQDRLEPLQLSQDLWMILLDTTLATGLFCSKGAFTNKLADHLKQTLSLLPKTAKIIIVNHFPLESSRSNPLDNSDLLLEILKQDRRICFYLHGHDHLHKVSDRRDESLPIFIDSGSATHKKQGSWTMLEYDLDRCTLTPFHVTPNKTWKQQKPITFILD